MVTEKSSKNQKKPPPDDCKTPVAAKKSELMKSSSRTGTTTAEKAAGKGEIPRLKKSEETMRSEDEVERKKSPGLGVTRSMMTVASPMRKTDSTVTTTTTMMVSPVRRRNLGAVPSTMSVATNASYMMTQLPTRPAGNRSDEYKKVSSNSKNQKEADNHKMRDMLQKNQDWSPECQIGFFIFSVMMAIALFSGLIVMVKEPTPKDEIIRRSYPKHQTERATVVLMSDNLDCTLFMKRQMLMKVEIRDVLLAGLQCMFINEPHSVAPDSGITMMTYYIQERESIINNANHGFMTKKLAACSEMKDTQKCDLQSFPEWITSFVDLSDSDFSSKNINSHWMRHCDQRYKKQYRNSFRKLARFEDYGTPEFQSVLRTTGYSMRTPRDTLPDTKVFHVSNLLEKAIQGRLSDSPNKRKVELFKDSYRDRFKISSVSTKAADRILVTKEIARYVIHHSLYCSTSKTHVPPALRRIRLHGLPGTRTSVPFLLIPDGPTHSIFAAFVVKTVYEAVVLTILNDPSLGSDWRPKEHVLYSWTMRAQLLAMHYFYQSREWTGNEENISMFDRAVLAAKAVTKKLPKDIYIPKRKIVDRSASIVIWYRKFTDEVYMLNAALPDLFDSAHIQEKTRSTFSRFEMKGKRKVKRSVEFTSVTSMIFTEQRLNDKESARPRYVIASSGSIRNVEGAAMALLRVILYDKPPGDVVSSPSIYLDVRNGKFFCDQTHNPTPETKALFSEATQDAGLECTNMTSKDFRHNDRIVMLASKKGDFRHQWDVSKGNVEKYMQAAMDQRAPDFNYPAGF